MALSDTLTMVGMVVGALIALAGQAIGLILYWNSIISELRKEHEEAIKLLHSRINNIRKEFVTDQQYQRELAEMKQGQREILSAIQGLGVSMKDKITDLEKENAVQEFRLGAIDDKINGRNIGRSSTEV